MCKFIGVVSVSLPKETFRLLPYRFARARGNSERYKNKNKERNLKQKKKKYTHKMMEDVAKPRVLLFSLIVQRDGCEIHDVEMRAVKVARKFVSRFHQHEPAPKQGKDK